MAVGEIGKFCHHLLRKTYLYLWLGVLPICKKGCQNSNSELEMKKIEDPNIFKAKTKEWIWENIPSY